MYHVYVLRSAVDGGFYVGISDNVERRVRQHNNGHQRSTRSRRPLRLVVEESFSTRAEAREREKYYKSGRGREQLRALYGGERQTRLRRAGAADD